MGVGRTSVASMSNELGALIAEEVKRGEADFSALRSRGQAVLTVSGGLITLLAAVLALSVGKDQHLDLDGVTGVAAVCALLAFVAATIFVLIMFLPSEIDVPDDAALAGFAQKEWESEGWDKQVAILLTTYLISLRAANASLANKLIASIVCEVLGIGGVALMALSLITSN